MPCLELTTNVTVTDQDILMRELSACVSKGLNKSETYMMVIINDTRPMFFSGNTDPTAHLTLRALGLKADAIKDLARTLTELLQRKLGIDSQRIYIVFMDADTSKWAWDGRTFA